MTRVGLKRGGELSGPLGQVLDPARVELLTEVLRSASRVGQRPAQPIGLAEAEVGGGQR